MLLVQLHRERCTHINDFIAIVDFEPLLGDGGNFPLGIVVPVGFVHIDDVLSQLGHL